MMIIKTTRKFQIVCSVMGMSFHMKIQWQHLYDALNEQENKITEMFTMKPDYNANISKSKL